MIEVKEILNDFEEIDVKSLATEYGITDERASIAVSLYNKALSKMHIGSYDSARIDLRKSVNMYPSFVESRILLGICVFALGDRTDAVAIFNTVRGENRERALDYLDKLHELSTRPESASFRSSSRQSRVPDAVFSSDNKLEEIMKADEKGVSERATASSSVRFDDGFDDDADIEVAVDGELHSSSVEDDKELSEETVSVNDTVENNVKMTVVEEKKSTDAKGAFNDNVASYDGIRRTSTERNNAKNSVRTQSGSYNTNERKNETQKKRGSQNESLERANRTISNLTIQKARMTILAMGIGLCCVILLIVVICLSVSNSNLKEEIDDLKKKTVSSQGIENGNTDKENNKNPSSGDGSQNDNTQNPAENASKALAAYNNAKTLFDSGKYVEAADLLFDVDLASLDSSTMQAAKTLYSDAVNKFSGEYFNKMYSNVAPENWQAVIEFGLPVYKHNIERTNENFSYSSSAVCFNLGKAYEFTGDTAKAKEFYNITISKYGTTADAGYASYRLSLLK